MSWSRYWWPLITWLYGEPSAAKPSGEPDLWSSHLSPDLDAVGVHPARSLGVGHRLDRLVGGGIDRRLGVRDSPAGSAPGGIVTSMIGSIATA